MEYRKHFFWGDRNNIGIDISTAPWIGVGITFGNFDEDDIKLWIGLGVQIWITAEIKVLRRFFKKTLFRKLQEKYQERNREIKIDLTLRPAALHLSLWADSWGEGISRKRKIYIDLADKFLGRNKYHEEILEEGETHIVMPEKVYPAKYKLSIQNWKRPLLPWTKQRKSYDFEIPEGIPVPGKGENSYDCGDDAIYGTGAEVKGDEGLRTATHKVAMRALETRHRYASLNWKPTERKEEKNTEQNLAGSDQSAA